MVLLFSTAAVAGAAEEIDMGSNSHEVSSVLAADLVSVMESASATELTVSIWIEEIETKLVEELVLAKSGYNRETIHAMVENGKADEITMENVNAYITAERAIYAQFQTAASEDFLYSDNISTSERLVPANRETYIGAMLSLSEHPI